MVKDVSPRPTVDRPHQPNSATESATWTTRRLIAWMTSAFGQSGLDSPRLIADMLMAHVLGCDRLKLVMDADRPASPLERQTLRDLVGRALNHEPVQYLVGQAWFYGLPMKVDRRVLIPRPATETIVDGVLRHVRARPGFGGPKGEGVLIADVCTGSGCIATAVLKYLTGARVVASDVSAEALEVAALNARTHEVSDRLDLLCGNLLEPILDYPPTRQAGGLHCLVSNPPYIPDHEWGGVPPNVKNHEPHVALRGGADGMEFVRTVVRDGVPLLRSGGLMMVEVAASCAPAALALAGSTPGLVDAEIVRDFEGHPRVLAARKG